MGRHHPLGLSANDCLPCCTCPPVAVECRTQAVIKAKCGYDTFEVLTPPKKYLKRTTSYSETSTHSNSQEDCGYITPSLDCHITSWTSGFSISDNRSKVETVDPETCEETCVPSGSKTRNDYEHRASDSSDTRCTYHSDNTTVTPGTCENVPVLAVEVRSPTLKDKSESSSESFDNGAGPGDACFGAGANLTSTTYAADSSILLEDEFTTALLVELAQAALDALALEDAEFSACSPSAARNLSTDEHSVSLSKAQYRFSFDVPGKGYARIKWRVMWQPEGGAAELVEEKELELSGADFDGYAMGEPYLTEIQELPMPEEDGEYFIEGVELLCTREDDDE